MAKKGWTEETEVDGRLKMLLVIVDPLTGKHIKVLSAPYELTGQIDRRVRAHGRARFNKDGEAISVKVDSFVRLPEQHECPQIEDLHRAKINITNGQDSADYVREMRDRE